jgi:NADPH:quinone reductase-like Zn-dependent oxidoreductase
VDADAENDVQQQVDELLHLSDAGPDVSSLKVGDEVAAVLWSGGAFAEECVCAASQAIRLPSRLLPDPTGT